jgi:signal transduction histidine kinase
VADDVHDDSIQVLTAVGYRLAGLRQHVDPEAEPKLELLGATIEQAIFRLRHLLFELRPPALDRMGLAAALSEYADRMAAEGALVVALEGDLEHEPSPQSRVLLYRIAQEALTNVRKHADAEHVRVHLSRDAGGVVVRVTDDGVGFRPRSAPGEVPGHIGLISMRERAELAGGWFSVESEPGAGTTVSFWIPDRSWV